MIEVFSNGLSCAIGIRLRTVGHCGGDANVRCLRPVRVSGKAFSPVSKLMNRVPFWLAPRALNRAIKSFGTRTALARRWMRPDAHARRIGAGAEDRRSSTQVLLPVSSCRAADSVIAPPALPAARHQEKSSTA